MWKKFIKLLFIVSALLVGLFILLRQPDLPLDYLKGKYADEQSRFISLQNMEVHYKVEGQGPPLLLIHGTAASLHTWDGWTDELKDDFTIIRLDLPAFGLTGPNPDADYSLDFYSNFIHQFIGQLDIDSLSLAGNSLGGNIAWHYTARYPDKVNKLILIDPAGFPGVTGSLATKMARNSLTAPFIKSITPRSFIKKNIRQVFYDDELISPELIDRYFELALRPGNRQAFIDRARTPFVDETDLLQLITIPTLIQWGAHDEWIPLKYAAQFQEKLSNNQLKVYETGHIPMEELPQETAKHVMSFLLTND